MAGYARRPPFGSRIPCAWRIANFLSMWTSRWTGSPKPRPHARRRDCESQAPSTRDNPLIAPSVGSLARGATPASESRYPVADDRQDVRTSHRSCHQEPMPLEQRDRRDDEGSPRRSKRPAMPPKRRTSILAPFRLSARKSILATIAEAARRPIRCQRSAEGRAGRSRARGQRAQRCHWRSCPNQRSRSGR